MRFIVHFSAPPRETGFRDKRHDPSQQILRRPPPLPPSRPPPRFRRLRMTIALGPLSRPRSCEKREEDRHLLITSAPSAARIVASISSAHIESAGMGCAGAGAKTAVARLFAPFGSSGEAPPTWAATICWESEVTLTMM